MELGMSESVHEHCSFLRTVVFINQFFLVGLQDILHLGLVNVGVGRLLVGDVRLNASLLEQSSFW